MIHHLAILSLTGPCEGALQGANVRTSYTSLRTPATHKRSQHTEKPALGRTFLRPETRYWDMVSNPGLIALRMSLRVQL